MANELAFETSRKALVKQFIAATPPEKQRDASERLGVRLGVWDRYWPFGLDQQLVRAHGIACRSRCCVADLRLMAIGPPPLGCPGWTTLL